MTASLINYYMHRRLGNGHLVTTDHGSWVFLSKKMFDDLRSDDIEKLPQDLLRGKGIIVDEMSVKDIEEDYHKLHKNLFCGISKHVVQTKGMSSDTLQRLVEFIPSGEKTIQFVGGTDLLNAQYIVDNIDKASFEIVTDKIDTPLLAFIQKNKVGLTFYGDVEKIKKTKSADINAILYVTKDVLGSPGIVEKYYDKGMSSVWIKPIHGMDRDWDTQGYSSEAYLTFWKKALDIVVKKSNFVEKSTMAILRKITTKDFIKGDDLCSPCPAAVTELAYNAKGDVFVCHGALGVPDFKLGNVKTHKCYDIIKGGLCQAIIKSSINDNSVCRVCAYRPFCGLCPVCSFAETGNIIARLPDRRCRILKDMFDHIFLKLIYDEEYRTVFDKWISF